MTQFNINTLYSDTDTNTNFFFSLTDEKTARFNIISGSKIHTVPLVRFYVENNVVTTSDTDIARICKYHSNPPKIEIVKKTKTYGRIGKEDKKNPLQVIRFVRPKDKHDNMRGVTLVFLLDYKNRNITVGISVCNGDNFCKETGVSLATDGTNYISGLYMPDGIYNCTSKDGLVKWFMEDSPVENSGNPNACYNINWKTIQLMLDIYADSCDNA
jgi:hypothetical protein